MSYIYSIIKVLQYRADRQDGHWLDDAISGWTKLFNPKTPPYSHSEICFSCGICFSAASRNPTDSNVSFIGTRFEDFEIITKNKKRWDVYAKRITAMEEKEMLKRASKIAGKKYYYAGLFLDFFLPFGWISSIFGKALNQWYCSQAVWYVLTGKRKRVSPRRLTNWLLFNGFYFNGTLK